MISEEDIYSKLWNPLLNGIVNTNNRLRVKSRETKTSRSTMEKSALYYNESKVEGFKTDFRIIYNNDGREIDLCSREVSKGIDDKTKIYHGVSKPPHLFGRKRLSSSSSSSSSFGSNTIVILSTSPVIENDKILADEFGFYRFGEK